GQAVALDDAAGQDQAGSGQGDTVRDGHVPAPRMLTVVRILGILIANEQIASGSGSGADSGSDSAPPVEHPAVGPGRRA
ncbi:hypothetical protein, partial [Kitasatospora xanthocidica]|uniref:hypothetical protein n=1 Tax=Kitasatospora xanthocidica TaxID=83382 RepID=UPI001E65C6C9